MHENRPTIAGSRDDPRRVLGSRRSASSRAKRWRGGLAFLLGLAGLAQGAGAIEGFPLMRFYPYEEIGRVSRGVQLSFDALGRLAVVQDDEYIVLNDNLWTRQSSEQLVGVGMYAATPDLDGTLLYGALGSWGQLVPAPNGRLVQQPLVPTDYPKWVLATNFDGILCRPEGVFFSGWNGVVFRNRATRRHQFFEVPGVSCVFAFAGKIYVSSHDRGVLVLDVARETLTTADPAVFGDIVVGRFASTGPESGLLSTSYRRLLIYRNGELQPLPPPLGPQLASGVTALVSLPEGDVAAAVTGVGLYIVSADGRVKLALTGPEYARVMALASREPGVLWAANETGVLKILYGQPFTRFGQALGLPVSWPQIVSWKGQIIIASSGRLYTPVPATMGGAPAQFQPMPGQPGEGAWGIAVVGDTLLVSNKDVYAYDPWTGFTIAVPGLSGARLVAIDATTCLVIGADRIAVIQRRDGRWAECAPRIPGVGYPAIVHAGKNSAWIELGVNRAARIGYHAGRLESRLFEAFPWQRPNWVNISVLGSTVVLAGSDNRQLYFDEDRQTLFDGGEIAALFRRAPHPIMRLCEDQAGTYWASHYRGIVAVTSAGGRPAFDAASYGVVDERIPLVQVLPDGDVWLSTGQSLYHLERSRVPPTPSRFEPVLVAVRDGRSQAEILRCVERPARLRPLRYEENNVTFQFFAGSYASMRPPLYEYQVNDGRWESVATGSAVALSDLHEGRYQLRVRLADSRGPLGPARELAFEVAPPWYRAWYALAGYPLFAGVFLFGIVRFSMRRAEARNVALEQLVAQRTSELQTTMQRLEQETRTSATLAERNRLAGEIHDSLEQGFTGLTLQLETTANFTRCPPEVKSGLGVALNMVAFCRNEVRHAVRDMHSPILTATDLETALRRILAQVAPFPDYAKLQVEGTPRRLSSTVEHHLLRIAQEAIANAVKHAAATHLAVGLAFHDTEIKLDIVDNGRGFEPEVVLGAGIGHFGLPSFRGRASKLGGSVVIASQPGCGTRITVRVPVEATVVL